MGVLCGTKDRRVHTLDIPEPGEGAEMFSPTDVALHQTCLAWGKKPGS